MNHYDKDRDNAALGKWYTDHVSAMTREGLHAKSDIAAELAYRDQRIATLEAEKAERERQEPVAWAWNDALGCMHAHCGSRRPAWVDGECSDAKRAETSLRPLYAAPPIPRVEQEPVAWIYRDSLNEPWKLGSGPQAMRWETLALYAAPPVPRVDPDWLANVIRTVDGNNTMGAGALAEKIAEAINGRAK